MESGQISWFLRFLFISSISKVPKGALIVKLLETGA
jgi:hypothetical protein